MTMMTTTTDDEPLVQKDGNGGPTQTSFLPLLHHHTKPTSNSSTVTTTTTAASATQSSSTSSSSSSVVWKEYGGVLRFLWGAGGIYFTFLYYGSLQEDVFRYEGGGGGKFTYAWFLQVVEAMANVLVGALGLRISGGTKNIPQKYFVITGASQVSSKAFTSLSLAKGLSFPVATLAKSGKMAPVMAGQLILGGASYTPREYLQVAAIIGGTMVLSLGKKKGGESHSTPLGLLFIFLSLAMDGVTAGFQKRLKANMAQVGVKPTPYDFMFYTNLYMAMVALVASLALGDFFSGLAYCGDNPQVLTLIVKFSICSAVGQSFIFYTVAHFDPLVCSTVTTTRKIFSVLLSIVFKGHHLSGQGWAGVALAFSGIISEIQSKFESSRTKKLKSKTNTQRKESDFSENMICENKGFGGHSENKEEVELVRLISK